jgi:hypothetical protein
MITWVYFPKSAQAPTVALEIVKAFKSAPGIDSAAQTNDSNYALKAVSPALRDAGFVVECGKKADQKIRVPVLFGRDGKIEKSFDADAYHEQSGFVVEVEAGRAVVNHQFLKDLFEACMMHNVNYLAIAVRNSYLGGNDFEKVTRFFETL